MNNAVLETVLVQQHEGERKFSLTIKGWKLKSMTNYATVATSLNKSLFDKHKGNKHQQPKFVSSFTTAENYYHVPK